MASYFATLWIMISSSPLSFLLSPFVLFAFQVNRIWCLIMKPLVASRAWPLVEAPSVDETSRSCVLPGH
uniref:Uncharacterized protein n=1 Tax=Arundo donax TaxID=35708 RepID=A0A0A9DGM1_ARUDO